MRSVTEALLSEDGGPEVSTLRKIVRRAVPETIISILRSARFRIRRFFFQPYIEKLNAEGDAFHFWIGDPVAEQWYTGNWFGPEIRFMRDRLVKPGDIVLECGAHHGCLTILFSHWVGETGSIVAFEPVTRNATLTRKNIELNRLKNVQVLNSAVGAREGSACVTNESNARITEGTLGGMRVAMTCLDEYAELNPTLLKIDVEGFEAEVLRGARSVLEKRPRLAVEIHTEALPRYGSSVEDILNLIDRERYTLWIQWRDEDEPVMYDGRTPIRHRVHLFAFPK